MIDNVKQYIEPFITMNEPVPYKNLLIYPFIMKDYYNFMLSVDILTQEKDKTNNIDIIQMSYLDYIIQILFTDNNFNDQWQEKNCTVWQKKFATIITVSLQCDINDINFCIDKKGKIFLMIKGQKILAKHFNDIIKIILHLNIPNYVDEYITPDVQEVIDKHLQEKSKNIYPPTLNKKILFVTANTNYHKLDILNMTLFDFESLFSLLLSELDYKINKTAEMSGNVEFKEKIEHFMFEKPHSIYDSIFQDSQVFEQKMGINKQNIKEE